MKLKSIPSLLTFAAVLAALAAAAMVAFQAAAAQAAPSAPVAHAAKAQTTVVSTRKTGLGTIVVGPSGRTLYLWEKDSRNHSKCSGACAQAWPPLMVHGKLKAGHGIKAKLLGSTARRGGRQVTYNGHPLYYFVGDSRPGQTTGEGSNGFGAEWNVVSAAGKEIDR